MIILCDFNFDILSPNNPATEHIDVMKNANLALSCKLDVTREFGDLKSCLHQVYFNIPVQWNHIFRSTITDHYFVLTKFAITLSFTKNDNQCKFNFVLNHELSKVQSKEIGLNDSFKQIQRITKDVADRYAPLRMLRHKKFNWEINKKRHQRFKQLTEDTTNQSN